MTILHTGETPSLPGGLSERLWRPLGKNPRDPDPWPPWPLPQPAPAVVAAPSRQRRRNRRRSPPLHPLSAERRHFGGSRGKVEPRRLPWQRCGTGAAARNPDGGAAAMDGRRCGEQLRPRVRARSGPCGPYLVCAGRYACGWSVVSSCMRSIMHCYDGGWWHTTHAGSFLLRWWWTINLRW
jgi:hypothetical protein